MSARAVAPPAAQWSAVGCLLALIALTLAWELVLAPARPGGSWLVLKVLPLLAPLRGLLHGRRYTAQWTTFLALGYFTEGVVRGWSERGAGQALALAEAALALALFVAVTVLARLTGAVARGESATVRSAD